MDFIQDSTFGISRISDTRGSGISDGTFNSKDRRENIHPMVQPFYSNLEIMDFLTSQKINLLV